MITTTTIVVLVQAQLDKSGFKLLRAYPKTQSFQEIANSDLDMFLEGADNSYDYYFLEVPMMISAKPERKEDNPLENERNHVLAQYK